MQRNPTIASKDDGDSTAAWVDLRSNQTNIWSSTLVDGAGNWTANKRITDNTAALKDFPDVAMDSTGVSYAVWQDRRNGNDDIFFSTLAAGGATWAANVKISDDPGTAHQTKPRIGVDAGGNLTAAWIDARTSPARVRVARKPAAGAWSASIEISLSPANAQSLALSVRSDGFAWATWGDTRAGATNQDIWGSRYDPNLNTWSAPVRLDDDPGTSANQLNPTVAFGPAETLLSWRDNRLSANGDTQARRVLFIQGMTDRFALAYDGLNRLKSVSGPVSESFALDGASNVTNRSGTLETYDNANRLTQDGATVQTWSNADRLTGRGSDTFGYDALDRMTSSTVGGNARTYTYNGDGLLQTRAGGVGATFLWDPWSAPSRELKQNSDNIVYGHGPLYVVKADATIVTFARDGSKNVRAEVNGAGAVTGAFRYRSYGQLAQNITAGPSYLGLASQLLDPSGLYYMRARWYDPVTGRFSTHDAASGDPKVPASLNTFGYAHANPANNLDPTGLFCIGASFGGNVAIGTIPLFGGPRGGGAAMASVSFVVCGGGKTGINAGFVGNIGGFVGTPRDTGVVPAKSANTAAGIYAGGGFAGVVSPNATKVSDFSGDFRTEAVSLGVGPLNGAVDFSHGKNENGQDIEVLTVTPPFLSFGAGAAYTNMNTTSLTGTLWSQSGGWISE